ncbi:hypothetical protein F5Y16DRAFT_396802 [Xylariaceae sp. FL0255]|nr:hypothetical protein F5Y16DRAFT_396802 [Xylariaceae sp. FL0255]
MFKNVIYSSTRAIAEVIRGHGPATEVIGGRTDPETTEVIHYGGSEGLLLWQVEVQRGLVTIKCATIFHFVLLASIMIITTITTIATTTTTLTTSISTLTTTTIVAPASRACVSFMPTKPATAEPLKPAP